MIIKFRCYDTTLSSMMSWFDICRAGYMEKMLSSENLITMQFSGVTDMNGVEVYSGDITQVFFNGRLLQFVVHHEPASFTLMHKCVESKLLLSDILMGEIRVLGNIYQNPELL